ncbi:MAG: fklB [Verrucomicrobiaceae bacterium]|nr:fklB [Verrucomicrobiaceae bacterium]
MASAQEVKIDAAAAPKDAKPDAAAAADADPMAGVPIDKVSYFIGRNIGKSMSGQGFKPDFDAFKEGMKSSIDSTPSKYPQAELSAAMEKFQAAMQASEGLRAAKNVKAGQDYLDTNGKRKEVTTTASGLQYEVLKAAEGPKPKATDTVKVHYHGTTIDGKVFDSSVDRNEPATFPLNGVIPGWTEGVQLMSKGSKFKFTIPAKLAYGEQGNQGIAPNSTLIFEVELLDINPAAAAAPEAPPAGK